MAKALLCYTLVSGIIIGYIIITIYEVVYKIERASECFLAPRYTRFIAFTSKKNYCSIHSHSSQGTKGKGGGGGLNLSAKYEENAKRHQLFSQIAVPCGRVDCSWKRGIPFVNRTQLMTTHIFQTFTKC